MEEKIKKYIEFTQRRKTHYASFREMKIKEQPNCYYCGCVMKLYPQINERNLKKGEYKPKDTATVEHLYSRFDMENRYKIYENNEDKVLACYGCNFARSIEEQKKIPIQLLAEREVLAKKWKREHPGEPRILGLIENTQKIFEAISIKP